MKSLPIIVLGGGGHARVVIDALLACNEQVLGFVDADPDKTDVEGLRRLGQVEYIAETYRSDKVLLANGFGSIGMPGARLTYFEKYKQWGFQFISVIHPRAIVSPSTTLEEGVQVMAGAIIQPGVSVGENSIINTGASVDHDCTIGSHVHVAPRATLSGTVRVGDCAHIGTGAVVIQGIDIGAESMVGAGSVVVKDVEKGSTVLGNPAVRKS
ncbi:MAG: acetyltransferase [Rhodothermaceae bacterium]|nr:acetyltransferase [Rhodothermaceae bacterium]